MASEFFQRWCRFSSLAIVFILFLTFPAMSQAEPEKSLYDRLGGYDAISGVIDVFLQKVWDDPTVGRYFVGMGTDTRNQLRQKNKNLLCYNTGGPCKKINRPLKLTHEGLGITDHDFNIVVNHLLDTLKEFKVPQREQNELLTKVGKLRAYIVEANGKK